MKDWPSDIVRLVGNKQAIAAIDAAHIWEHHVPKVAATEDERQLGVQLGSRPLKPTTRSSVGASPATSTTGA